MQADQLAKTTLQDFSTTLKDYTAASGVEEKRKDLNAQIQDTHGRLLNKNTALMAAFCYDPLQEAYRELRMQVFYPPGVQSVHGQFFIELMSFMSGSHFGHTSVMS